MSGAVTAAAVAAVAGTAYSVYSGERQASEQRKAQRQAEKQAKEQAKEAEMAMNRENQKTPDPAALLDSASRPMGGSTMLTGAGGVDPNALQLSKNTLLGG